MMTKPYDHDDDTDDGNDHKNDSYTAAGAAPGAGAASGSWFLVLGSDRKAAVPTGSREPAPVRTGTGGTGTGGTGTRNRTARTGTGPHRNRTERFFNSRNPRNLEIDRILEIPEF